mgnify:CR=1 FL=1
MQRLDRYKAVAEDLINRGHAYYCYATKEELDTLREQQRAEQREVFPVVDKRPLERSVKDVATCQPERVF